MSGYDPAAADRAHASLMGAVDMAAWANLVASVLATAGNTFTATDLVCASDAESRVCQTLVDLSDQRIPVDLDQLRQALPTALRPLIGGLPGWPRLTDLMAAAAELTAAALTHAVGTGAVISTENDQLIAHLEYAGSLLRQAVGLVDPDAAAAFYADSHPMVMAESVATPAFPHSVKGAHR